MVSDKRVVLNGITYPRSAINSVCMTEMTEDDPAIVSKVFWLSMLATILIFTCIGAPFAVFLFIKGVRLHKNRKRIRYHIHLSTAGVQKDAIQSLDKQLMLTIQAAINQAILA